MSTLGLIFRALPTTAALIWVAVKDDHVPFAMLLYSIWAAIELAALNGKR